MKFKKIYLLYLSIFVLSILLIQSCASYYFRSNYRDVNSLLHETKNITTKPFLKAHLKNGDICIFKDSWKIDSLQNRLRGSGSRFDFNRSLKSDGALSIAIDSIAIFETNTKILNPETGRLAFLGILTAVDVAIGIFCITNPKACFGSCPTFYINEKDNFHYADAEGFSNAIAPSMEYGDIDALYHAPLKQNEFSLTMKNEALETHCVKEVKLLTYPKKQNEHIYHSSNDEFYLCTGIHPLNKAMAEEGEVTDKLKNADRIERFSSSYEKNLKSKEEIYLDFIADDEIKNPGLILHFRQSLMSTYFIYSAMGYMGNEVGDMFAKLETHPETKEKLKNGIQKELGGIEIFQLNSENNTWEFQSEFNETGPIAINKQIIPLNKHKVGNKIKLKMVLNKGLWRIDYVALTNIKEKVKPIEILANSILNKGKADPLALKQLNDPKTYLISMPGSEYKLNFRLPDKNTDYELFLYSKGYYLEWMRAHWIKDKDLLKLRQMVESPKEYLKSEAKNYKQYENNMEQEFWNSKVDTKNFSYHEK